MKIIIADDHELLLDTLGNSLKQRFPFSTIAKAVNKDEVFQQLNENPFDILLQDIRFGGTDARNFIPELSIRYPHLKIVVFTSISDQLSLTRMAASPVHALVSKTDSIEEIISAISSKKEDKPFLSKTVQSILSTNAEISTALSERELEILKQISNGKTSKEISETLFISIKTVEMHRSNLFSKLNVTNAVALVKKAITLNLLDE